MKPFLHLLKIGYSQVLPQKVLKLRLLIFAAALFSIVQASAQAPQGINYQAVLHDNTGAIIANRHVSLAVSILNDSLTGPVIYSETHNDSTNQHGIIVIVIGGGSGVIGNFDSIAWGAGAKFLKLGLDPTGGSNYTDIGITQLLSVPYALYANNAGNSGNGVKSTQIDSNGNMSIVTLSSDTLTSPTGVWTTAGNYGASTSNAFVGTNDNSDLIIKRGGMEKMRLTSTGLGVGVTTPLTAVDILGALTVRDTIINVSSDDSVIIGNKGTIVLNSLVPLFSPSPVISFSPGSVRGQILFVRHYTSGTGCKILNSSLVKVALGLLSMQNNCMMMFMWDGTQWQEMSYSQN